SFAAALTASSSPPSASTILSDSACVPENTRPSANCTTCSRGSLRPLATASMNWPWTSSSSVCSTRRSSPVIARAMLPMSLNAADGVVDLLRGAHHPARAVDADDHGLDAGIVAVLPQFAHKIVGLGDEPFELDDRDFGAEERAAVAATAAPRATDEQEEPDHPAQHEHGGHQHRQPMAHLFLVVVVVF